MSAAKMITPLLLLAGSILTVNAQDIITKKNGDEIQSKVLEVGTNDVKYKKFKNESGPTYTLSKSEIFMIKYENGDKDMFEKTETNSPIKTETNNLPVQNVVSTQNPDENPVQTQAPAPTKTETPAPMRKGYVGIAFGGASLTKEYSNVDNGTQVNFNFGYLFNEHVGITATIFGTSFGLSNYTDASIGLTGFLAGPLFSTAVESGVIELDLRPMIGFASGSATIGNKSGTTDETTFAAAIGGSIRWNCGKRVSLCGNIDYYNGTIEDVNLSSFGITVGVNLRF